MSATPSRRSLFAGLATLLALAVALFVPAGSAGANQSANPSLTTLTFNELPYQPVTGLSFRGVAFSFTVGGINSADAYYNGVGPGTLVYVQDPALEGNAAGTLTLRFNRPTSVLKFGVAVSCFGCTLSNGASVELFGPYGQSHSITLLRTRSLVSFSEGRFTYAGPPIERVVIRFNAAHASRFALDNLTFQGPSNGYPPPHSPNPHSSRPGRAWLTSNTPVNE